MDLFFDLMYLILFEIPGSAHLAPDLRCLLKGIDLYFLCFDQWSEHLFETNPVLIDRRRMFAPGLQPVQELSTRFFRYFCQLSLDREVCEVAQLAFIALK